MQQRFKKMSRLNKSNVKVYLLIFLLSLDERIFTTVPSVMN